MNLETSSISSPDARASDALRSPCHSGVALAARTLLGAAALAAYGCAAAAPTPPRPVPLAANAPVAVLANRADAPQPAVIVGTLRAKTQSADDRDDVLESFLIKARLQGCNTIAELSSTEAEVRASKSVPVAGQDGKEPPTRQTVVTGHEYKWTALCMRVKPPVRTKTAAPTAKSPPVGSAVTESPAPAPAQHAAEPAERVQPPPARALASSKPVPVAAAVTPPQEVALPVKPAPRTTAAVAKPVAVEKPAGPVATPAPPPSTAKPAVAPTAKTRAPAPRPPAVPRGEDGDDGSPDPTPI